MKVLVVSLDQGVDGACVLGVAADAAGTDRIELEYRRKHTMGSIDTFVVEEFEVVGHFPTGA